MVCGYLTVSEKHGQENGPTIQLAVAIIKSLSASPEPDPLFFAQGGPGGSTIDTYVETLLTDSDLRANRDIILFDQRGTKYSRPNLYCTEIDQLTSDTIEKDLSAAESEALNRQALDACRDRLLVQGINLSNYDTLENASDIEQLRHDLGYKSINLYGVSYGTLLALQYMRNFPNSLRSVILDGVVPPQSNPYVDSAHEFDWALTRLFRACAADKACDRAYPNLEEITFDVADRLNAQPARVSMTDPETQVTYDQAIIDGDTFIYGIYQLLYIGDIIPALPRMIYDARDGKFDVFARIMAFLIFDHSISLGMHYAVRCAENADFSATDQVLKGIRPQIVELEKRTPQAFLDICRDWQIEQLGKEADQPVISDIPTLILSGGLDPATPPENGQIVAQTLARSFNYVFPAGGHGQALKDCADNMILAFLNNPEKAPDAACMEKTPAPVFFTPSNLVDLPVVARFLNLEGSSGIELLLLFLGAFFLGSSLFFFPIIWVVRRIMRKPTPVAIAHEANIYPTSFEVQSIDNQAVNLSTADPSPGPFLVFVAKWIAGLGSIVLGTILLALLITLVVMVIQNDNRIFYGLPGSARLWLGLSDVYAVLALGMLASGIALWVKQRWPLWERIYYSLLTITALVCLLILAKWGMLTAFLR